MAVHGAEGVAALPWSLGTRLASWIYLSFVLSCALRRGFFSAWSPHPILQIGNEITLKAHCLH